jgi:hypothetical protein
MITVLRCGGAVWGIHAAIHLKPGLSLRHYAEMLHQFILINGELIRAAKPTISGHSLDIEHAIGNVFPFLAMIATAPEKWIGNTPTAALATGE